MINVIVAFIANPFVIAGLICGFSYFLYTFLLSFYVFTDGNATQTKSEKNTTGIAKKKTITIVKSKKKTLENKWSSKEKQFSNPWLLKSLKGHRGQILNMDFSSNGKYLATCGDEDPDLDPDPGGTSTTDASSSTSSISSTNSSNSSGSDSNKNSSATPSTESSPRVKGLSRRQRKNRKREETSSSTIQPKTKSKSRRIKSSAAKKGANMFTIPYKEFGLTETKFISLLENYVILYDQMETLGYPIEYDDNSVKIFRNFNFFHKTVGSHKINGKRSQFDVNAKEFVPSEKRWTWNGSSSSDTEQTSSSSSESGEDDASTGSSQISEGETPEVLELPQDTTQPSATILDEGDSREIPCSRCGRPFFISNTQYLSHERCQFHWGKLTKFLLRDKYQYVIRHECCGKPEGSMGCSVGKLHVWNGILSGYNGPYAGFVRTKPRRHRAQSAGVYALDCEMSYTVRGMEVVKVSVVAMDGRLVYESLVYPLCPVVDYNTRFSGVTARDFDGGAKTLREVQNDLMGFIFADTILIGHGLENDLRVLKILHFTIVDTALCFPHRYGLPYKRSLKSLAMSILDKHIQTGFDGHSSYEDAAACMELMLWKVCNDFLSHRDGTDAYFQ